MSGCILNKYSNKLSDYVNCAAAQMCIITKWINVAEGRFHIPGIHKNVGLSASM